MMTKIHLLPGRPVMIPQMHLLPGGSVMAPRSHLPQGRSAMTPRIHLPQGGSTMTPQIHLPQGGSAMTPRILLPQGGSAMTQMLLPPGGLIVILQLYLLREAIMVPQAPHPQDRPITTPLLQPSIEGLLTLPVHSTTGGPVTIPLIWNCLKPRVAKLQKDPLARQYPRVG